MKIDNFSVEQQAASNYQRVERQVVRMEIQQFNVEDALDISEEGLHMVEEKDAIEESMSEEDKRKIELLESFITWLTGKKFKFSRVAQTKKNENKKVRKSENKKVRKSSNQNQSIGIRIHRSHEVYEKEQMSFSSKGVVNTSDGRSIDFEFKLNMSRETYEKNETTLTMGNFHDPLVLNFDGKGVDFGDKKIRIDLDLDGNEDEFNFLSQGSGFLALDKNNNGLIDSGLELFGPQTNSGFGELRTFDLDGNSWIDENDDVFNNLKIWTIGDDGKETLIGLKEAGVGAIYLGDVASNYTLKHGDEDMAKIAGSSIYLKENGEANVIHEVDIKI